MDNLLYKNSLIYKCYLLWIVEWMNYGRFVYQYK